MTLAFYNEIDPYAAQWLRNLIAAGHIAPGIVDERDIRDIRPEELADFTQCHFFAGIGIWSRALRQAGWADDRPVWTGSCPCQPFSAAGRGDGVADERHLWPHWFWLIDQCRPAIVLGEQVSSKAGLGWFDLVSTDMEGAGYAVGASDLCAAGFSGAHLRQRLYFVGLDDSVQPGLERLAGDDGAARRQGTGRPITQTSALGGLVQPDGDRCEPRKPAASPARHGSPANSTGSERDSFGRDGLLRHPRQTRSFDHANVDWLLCRNPAGQPSWRPVEPGAFPLAHGITARMDKLRALGNGLDAETATAFCEVVREITE